MYTLSGLQSLNNAFGQQLGYQGNLGTKQMARLAPYIKDDPATLPPVGGMSGGPMSSGDQLKIAQDQAAMNAIYNPAAVAEQQANIQRANMTPLQKLQEQAAMAALQQQMQASQPRNPQSLQEWSAAPIDPNANLRTAAEAAQLKAEASDAKARMEANRIGTNQMYSNKSGMVKPSLPMGGKSSGSSGSSSSPSRVTGGTGTGGLDALNSGTGSITGTANGLTGLPSSNKMASYQPIVTKPVAAVNNPGGTKSSYDYTSSLVGKPNSGPAGPTGLKNSTTVGAVQDPATQAASVLNNPGSGGSLKPINYDTGIGSAQAAPPKKSK